MSCSIEHANLFLHIAVQPVMSMLGIAPHILEWWLSIFTAQDIKLHIKPMPKKVTFVPDILTKLMSKAVMFSVSTSKSPNFSGDGHHPA